MSLRAALQELLGEPGDKASCVYHMVTVLQNPDHDNFWLEAAKGKDVDYERVFKGMRATVDLPGAAFYADIMQQYPDCKVVLTVRDPDKWHQSCMDTIYWLRQNMETRWHRRIFIPTADRHRRMVDAVFWNGCFSGKMSDRKHATQVFLDHIERVKRTVPPERLLVFNVSEGWEPLCNFLGLPVPDKPFPHINDSATFRPMLQHIVTWQRVTAARRQAYAVALMLALLVVLFVALQFTLWAP